MHIDICAHSVTRTWNYMAMRYEVIHFSHDRTAIT